MKYFYTILLLTFATIVYSKNVNSIFPILDESIIFDDLFFESIDTTNGINQSEFLSLFNNDTLNPPISFWNKSQFVTYNFIPVGRIEINSKIGYIYCVIKNDTKLNLWMKKVMISISENLIITNTIEIGRRMNYYSFPEEKNEINSIIYNNKIFMYHRKDSVMSEVNFFSEEDKKGEFLKTSDILKNNIKRKCFNKVEFDIEMFSANLLTLKNSDSSFVELKFVNEIRLTRNKSVLILIRKHDDYYSDIVLYQIDDGIPNKEIKILAELYYGQDGQLLNYQKAILSKTSNKLVINTIDLQGNEAELSYDIK